MRKGKKGSKMKRHVIISFVLAVSFLVLAFPIFSFPNGAFGAPWRPQSVIVINAYCFTNHEDVRVSITLDGSVMSYRTPYAIYLNGTHTITVPNTDSDGHPFTVWNTGEKTPTITVAWRGTYTAYYGVSTYDVTINASIKDAGNVNVAIAEDGVPTGFDTPHTFTELTGTHNFTVPSTDPSGHSFVHWVDPSESISMFTTIKVSSGGTYTAYYDIGLCRFVTPSDPAVIEAAGNRSWAEMLDYVSSHISYGNNTAWQSPNETLALGFGQCRDYSTLWVSMLRARGYTAYVVVGTADSSGVPEGHAWVVINLNGSFIHAEPQVALRNQQFINFTEYRAESYFDENGVYPPIASKDPHLLVTQPDTLNVTSVLIAAIAFVAATALVFALRRKKQKPRSFTPKKA